MYSQLRILVVDKYDPKTGKPTVTGNAIPLIADEKLEVNNISMTLTPKEVTKEYKADDRVVQDTVLEGFEGTITFYGIDKTALAALTSCTVDSQGNLVFEDNPNGNSAVVLFARGKDAKGKKFNRWLYNVEFKNPGFASEQEGDTPAEQSLSFFAAKVPMGKHNVVGITVYEDSTGYLAEGTEPTGAAIVLPTFAA